MALADVTPAYVDVLTNYQYTTRTANASEFAALKDMLSVYLNTNTCMLPDKKYTHGLALLIAHYYTYGPKDGETSGGGSGGGTGSGTSDTGGPVLSKHVGDMSITYGDPRSGAGSGSGSGGGTDPWFAWLNESIYGRQFITLMKTSKPLPVVTC